MSSAGGNATHVLLSPVENLELEHDDNRLIARLGDISQVISGASGRVARALAFLDQPRSWSALLAAGPIESTDESEAFVRQVQSLIRHRLVTVRLVRADRALATLRADGPLARFRPPTSPRHDRAVLSRFALIRRDESDLVVECPHTNLAVFVHEPALLTALADGGGADAGAGGLRWLMLACGAFEESSDGVSSDGWAGDPALRQREPHDLFLHSRSRRGLTRAAVGATFRFTDVCPPSPAIRVDRVAPERVVPLPTGGEHDPVEAVSLAETLRRRRSVRAHGTTAITRTELSTFLHHTARVDRVLPAGPGGYESSVRPYPSGGAMYDLEIYLTVGRCADLAPGMYRYLPVDHALEDLGTAAHYRELLLQEACGASRATDPPQILITLATRFDRLSWKYEGLSYATTLKNVGVLYATMYLVATAMGLAPCALGSGNSAVFARATGLSPLVESSVGEFMLGSSPKR